ncbi:MAG: hypothetical protein JSS72_05220 [Armatimonadetes bacterium]|nr:hypothetical protein [Armatimonadota bacterium]
MNSLKISDVLQILVVMLLAAGYFASLSASMNDRAAEYAKQVDTPQIALIATLTLIASVGYACYRGLQAKKSS